MQQSSMTTTAQRSGILPLVTRKHFGPPAPKGFPVALGFAVQPGKGVRRELTCTCDTAWNGPCDRCKQQTMPQAAEVA